MRCSVVFFCSVVVLIGATAAQAKPHLYDRVVVLCIGIDKYKHVPDVKYGIADAKAVGAQLAKDYDFTADYLLGAEATRAAIDAELEHYRKALGERDVLIVFFSGHGQSVDRPSYGRAGFLVPYDARVDLKETKDLDTWKAQCIDMQELVKTAEAMKARHVLLIADACCSGALTKKGDITTDVDLKVLTQYRSRVALAATADSDGLRSAAWDDRLGHGVFTAHLLEVLKRDDAASVTEVFFEVRKRVIKTSGEHMIPQKSSIGDGPGEFVFLPISIPKADIDAVLDFEPNDPAATKRGKGVLQRLRERSGRQTTVRDVIEAFQTLDYRFSVAHDEREKVWVEKFKRFEENAAGGDPLAMAALVYCYKNGLGTEKKPRLAERWAQRAYDTGHPAGKHVLGKCLIEAEKPNEIAAFRLIQEAAAAKPPFPLSLLTLGYRANEKKESKKEAADYFRKAADAGVDEALRQLAILELFSSPQGVDRKAIELAIHRLESAARRDYADAQFSLAILRSGTFASVRKAGLKDSAETEKWLRRAANQGHAESQYVLARELLPEVHSMGIDEQRWLDLKMDPKQALRYLRLAANNGSSKAMVLLANCYEISIPGFPIEPDWDKAREWCEKAAKLNEPKAFLLQSHWYMNGKSIYKKDTDKAAKLAQRAAGGTDADALFWAGVLYADRVIPPEMMGDSDYFRPGGGKKPILIYAHHAFYYWTLAARYGHPKATEYLQEFAKRFPANDIVWTFFRRNYADVIPEFEQITGRKVPDP